jgi:hypothetical protein
MLSLPIAFVSAIEVFAPVFSRPVWQHVQVLMTGAVLAAGEAHGDGDSSDYGAECRFELSGLSSGPESRRLVAAHRQSAAAQALSGGVQPCGSRRLWPR